MIWYKYREHDYMDESPNVGYRLFEDEKKAYAREEHMNTNYSGGRTWIIGPATTMLITRTIKIILKPVKTQNILNNLTILCYRVYTGHIVS